MLGDADFSIPFVLFRLLNIAVFCAALVYLFKRFVVPFVHEQHEREDAHAIELTHQVILLKEALRDGEAEIDTRACESKTIVKKLDLWTQNLDQLASKRVNFYKTRQRVACDRDVNKQKALKQAIFKRTTLQRIRAEVAANLDATYSSAQSKTAFARKIVHYLDLAQEKS